MRILFTFGTRPEAIKLAPLILKFKEKIDYDVYVCNTSQHKEMLNPILDFFSIKPEFDLNVMEKNQDLFTITVKILKKIKQIILEINPDIIFVQGDTTTVFVSSLAAFYLKKKLLI